MAASTRMKRNFYKTVVKPAMPYTETGDGAKDASIEGAQFSLRATRIDRMTNEYVKEHQIETK